MAEHGVAIQRPKLVAAWVAEKAGRLKFNRHLLRRSPLTPFVEALAVGTHGKPLLWRALQEAAAGAPLEDLIARSERQHGAVERREAGSAALSGARAR